MQTIVRPDDVQVQRLPIGQTDGGEIMYATSLVFREKDAHHDIAIGPFMPGEWEGFIEYVSDPEAARAKADIAIVGAGALKDIERAGGKLAGSLKQQRRG